MKHFLMTLGLVAAVFSANAASFVEGGITYTTLSENTVEVSQPSTPYTGTVTIPETVTHDGITYTVTQTGFKAFSKVTKVIMPNTIKVLNRSFDYCTPLQEVVLSNTLERIELASFEGCSNMASIDIPETVTWIGNDAFYACTKLKTFHFPAALVGIGTKGILSGCSGLETITVDPANTAFASVDGVLYNKALTRIIQVPNQKTNVVLPLTLTDIASYAFYNCTKIPGIVIPNEIKTIGEGSFWNATGMTSIDIGSGVESIDRYGFTNCAPTTLICRASVPPKTSEESVFTCTETTTLQVPEASVEAYKSTSPWSKFVNIEPLAAAPVTIKVKFDGTTDVTLLPNMELPFVLTNTGSDPVTSIGYIFNIDGVEDASTTQVSNFAPFGNYTFMLNISKLGEGQHTITFTVATVNGVANTADEKTASCTINIVKVPELPADAPKATYSSLGNISQLGNGTKNYPSYDGALQLVEPDLAGWKVIGLEILGMETDGFKNHKLWYSPDGIQSPNRESVGAVLDGSVLKSAFVHPYTLTDKGVYLGFSMERASEGANRWPVPYCDETAPNDHCLFVLFGNSDLSNFYGYGTLPAIVYLEGPAKPNSMKLLEATSSLAVTKGETLNVDFTVQNFGTNNIDNFDYSYTLNGKTVTGTVNLTEPIANFMVRTTSVTVPFEAVPQAGTYPVSLTITKVNGQPNGYETKAYDFAINASDFRTTHRPIMEEFTGVGCGYCPRGTLGMAEMGKRVPDFIGAAYHRYGGAGDPMYLAEPQPFYASGAPGAMIDRNGLNVDPYFGVNGEPMGIETYYKEQAKILAPADITATCVWDVLNPGFKINGSLKFAYTEANETYSVGLILTVDSLQGTGEAWKQVNYYEGGSSSDPLLETVCNGTFDLGVYNHVVFDQQKAKGFVSFPASEITLGQDKEFSYSVGVSNSLYDPETFTASGPRNVHAIVVLLDSKGRVRNALKVAAYNSGDEPTGVEEIATDRQNVQYYDLTGRRISRPANGIFIEKAGSTTRKVLL